LAAAAWIARTYVAYELSQSASVKDLELAVKLDPGNAQYHLNLARLYVWGQPNYERIVREGWVTLFGSE
jgi:hypothetical protein